MIVKFRLFRSKYPDQMIIGGEVDHEIEDTILPCLDDYILQLIDYTARKLSVVQKYGIAYVGSTKIDEIIIEERDNISLNEQGFKEYINNIYTDINVVWQKTNNKDSEDVINKKVL